MITLKKGQIITEEMLDSPIFKFETDSSETQGKYNLITSEDRARFRIVSVERMDEPSEGCKVKYSSCSTDTINPLLEEIIDWGDFSIQGIETLLKIDFHKHMMNMLEARLEHIDYNYGVNDRTIIDDSLSNDDKEWLMEYKKCSSIYDKLDTREPLSQTEISYVNETVVLEGIFKLFNYELFILNNPNTLNKNNGVKNK